MPLLTLDLTSPPLTPAQRLQIQQGLTQLMASVLNKVAGLTVVRLQEHAEPSAWSVGGRPLVPGEWCASLHVAITEGSNSLQQQSTFLAAAHDLLQAVLGQPPAAPLYIVVQNVPGAHWGFGGRTQASRQKRAQEGLPRSLRQWAGAPGAEALGAQATALVLLDFQREYEPDGRLPLASVGAAAHEAERLVQAADAAGVPVVHVHHVAAQPNAPLFDRDGAGVSAMSKPALAAHHLRVVKHWPSAFHDTALLQALRERDVRTVVLAGCMTHNCVDSTARHAAHVGLHVVVVGDACATRALPSADGGVVPAEVVHRAALAALADRHATVVSAREVVSKWRLAASEAVAQPASA